MFKLKPSVGSRPQDPLPTSSRTTRFVLYYCILLTLWFLYLLANQYVITPIQAQAAHSSETSIARDNITPVVIPSPAAQPSLETLEPSDVASLIEQYQPIKNYITTLFGKNASTAYGIAFAESGKTDRPTGKPYFLTYYIHASDNEMSIGVFQVNLKSKYAHVHYDRIPARDSDPEKELAKKIAWLQNPYNNVLFAHWVYATSGFYPWSTYSDGKYLSFVQ